MPAKKYIVQFKPPETSVQPATAESVEVDDKCLIFLREDGALAALFDLDVVESWRESD
jgi:hypothetical protein